MNIEISLASESDAVTITKLVVASHKLGYSDIIPSEILSTLDDSDSSGWVSTIQKFPENVLIAKDEAAQIVGFCCAGPVINQEKNANFDGQVYGIHVKPGLNGKGIGSQLLKASLENMKRRGLKSVIVWTFQTNARAINFYVTHGASFVKEGPMNYHGLPMIEVAYGWRHL